LALTGVLNFNKPPHETSFAMVSLARRLSGEKRVGHAGTLDPLATGVLLLLFGQATRISEYLLDLPKTYVATVRLGLSTDTYDAEGTVTAEADPSEITEAAIREVLPRFVGELEQLPPAHSALKVAGQPAYKLARRGGQPQLKPRRVSIYGIELLGFEPPHLTLEVHCGRGVYIRSLAHDLGRQLGCGGHVSALQRTRIGHFALADALAVKELPQALADEERGRIQTIAQALRHLPQLPLSAPEAQQLRNGLPVQLAGPEAASEGVQLAVAGSQAVAIVRFQPDTGVWQPEKVFTNG
jgi:tRNA pseudouridine55 synthase